MITIKDCEQCTNYRPFYDNTGLPNSDYIAEHQCNRLGKHDILFGEDEETVINCPREMNQKNEE